MKLSDQEVSIINSALKILEEKMKYDVDPQMFNSPQASRDYAKLILAPLEHEVFAVFWLDNRNRLIDYEEMFRGTINGASVHPREVVKSALSRNAAACIFAHNHPSGVADPSNADRMITNKLKDALAVVDVRVLDHVIVGEDVISMAEMGLI